MAGHERQRASRRQRRAGDGRRSEGVGQRIERGVDRERLNGAKRPCNMARARVRRRSGWYSLPVTTYMFRQTAILVPGENDGLKLIGMKPPWAGLPVLAT